MNPKQDVEKEYIPKTTIKEIIQQELKEEKRTLIYPNQVMIEEDYDEAPWFTHGYELGGEG